MKKSFWRAICITCIVLSVLLAIFHVVIYCLVGVAAVLLMLLTLNSDPVDIQQYPSWGEFYANFVGSPMFYIDLAVGAVLVLSAVMWIVCKKREGKPNDQ